MSLKEKFRDKMALWWWKLNGHKTNRSFKISADGISAKHLAIILPPDFEDFDVARHALDFLTKETQAQKVTIFVRDNFRSWIPAGSQTISYDTMRKNWMGFPENELCKTAQRIDADVTIDLTPKFSVYTSRLAAATEASLCMSLNHEHAAKFFNVVVTPVEGRTLRERYGVLLSYL